MSTIFSTCQWPSLYARDFLFTRTGLDRFRLTETNLILPARMSGARLHGPTYHHYFTIDYQPSSAIFTPSRIPP